MRAVKAALKNFPPKALKPPFITRSYVRVPSTMDGVSALARMPASMPMPSMRGMVKAESGPTPGCDCP